MRYVKWALLLIVATVVFAFLHYTLPQTDIVRVTDTYEKRIDFGENTIFWSRAESGSDPNVTNRDVFFIQTIQRNDRPMVYRNEDTGWGWPPYFKFDTSNLQTEAADLRSTKEDPQWVALRHYGWRIELWTVFPNAVSIRPVEGPDVTIIPWFNIILLALVALFFFWLWRVWVRFRRRTVEPLMDDASDRLEQIDDKIDDTRGRFRKWRDSWRDPAKK